VSGRLDGQGASDKPCQVERIAPRSATLVDGSDRVTRASQKAPQVGRRIGDVDLNRLAVDQQVHDKLTSHAVDRPR
jgi:hypothetical protein